MRSPLTNPRPGDVVPCNHVFPLLQTLTVDWVRNGEIRCFTNGGPAAITMSTNQWMEWMPLPEVIHRGCERQWHNLTN